MTQPHYNGWDLPRKIWSQMPPFCGRPDLEYFRLDAMKRLYRLGQKDPPLAELQKIRDEIEYMIGELKMMTSNEIISAWKQGVPLEQLLVWTGYQTENEFAEWLKKHGECYGCNK